MLDFLFKPQPEISYDVISYAYAVGLLISIVFAVLEYVLLVEEIKGFWIIFAPFSACLVWSLVMQRAAKKMENIQKKED
jgi:hypothetical protein